MTAVLAVLVVQKLNSTFKQLYVSFFKNLLYT
jgi:hypothetical protein